jgi:ABC-type dipeptide/oligopeptide/nickel transport system ATPase component
VREQTAAMTTAVGCSFSPRCPFADDRCRAQSPPLQRIDSSRAAACWRLDVAAPDVLAGRQGGGNLTA